MPPSEKETGASRREAILESAIAEFASHGFDGASTSTIARRSGVTQPLVHYHFGSKEALWQAAVDLLFEDVNARFGHIDEELARVDPAELLRDMIRRFVRQCAERPAIAQIVLREATRPNPRFEWLVQRHVLPLVGRIANLVADLQAGGALIEVPPVHLLFLVMGGANLLFSAPALFEALAGRPPAAPEVVAAHAETMVALLDRSLGASPTSGSPGRPRRAPPP